MWESLPVPFLKSAASVLQIEFKKKKTLTKEEPRKRKNVAVSCLLIFSVYTQLLRKAWHETGYKNRNFTVRLGSRAKEEPTQHQEPAFWATPRITPSDLSLFNRIQAVKIGASFACDFAFPIFNSCPFRPEGLRTNTEQNRTSFAAFPGSLSVFLCSCFRFTLLYFARTREVDRSWSVALTFLLVILCFSLLVHTPRFWNPCWRAKWECSFLLVIFFLGFWVSLFWPLRPFLVCFVGKWSAPEENEKQKKVGFLVAQTVRSVTGFAKLKMLFRRFAVMFLICTASVCSGVTDPRDGEWIITHGNLHCVIWALKLRAFHCFNVCLVHGRENNNCWRRFIAPVLGKHLKFFPHFTWVISLVFFASCLFSVLVCCSLFGEIVVLMNNFPEASPSGDAFQYCIT